MPPQAFCSLNDAYSSNFYNKNKLNNSSESKQPEKPAITHQPVQKQPVVQDHQKNSDQVETPEQVSHPVYVQPKTTQQNCQNCPNCANRDPIYQYPIKHMQPYPQSLMYHMQPHEYGKRVNLVEHFGPGMGMGIGYGSHEQNLENMVRMILWILILIFIIQLVKIMVKLIKN